MGTCGAGSDHRVIGAFEAVFDRNIAGKQVNQGARNKKRTDPPRSFFMQGDGSRLNGGQTADAGAGKNTGA